MLTRKLFAAALLLGAVFAGGANAAIIYNNGGPNQVNGNEATEWVQTENFSVPQNAQLTDAHFWSVENGAWDGTLDWYVFADVGGQPGAAPLASGSGTNVVKTATGNVLFFGSEFEYNFDLNSPVNLTGGTNYWFGIHLSANYDRDEIYWETTAPTAGNGTESMGGTFNNWFNNGQEHAFYLTGTAGAVPEPATMVLFGAGLAGLGAMRRRRKAKA